MKSSASVVIIGGGISGLATAWWLHKTGVAVKVLERENEVGGTMQTVREDGWLVETGPNSALETTPLFKTLFSDLRLESELVYPSEISDNRYILRGGQLHALPMKPAAFLKSKLWSWPGKLRLLREPFVGRAKEEETIAQFVERRLGREFLDYAINPFVAGVYAGNPEQLSVRAAFPKLYALEEKYGGLIKGQIRGARERKKRAEKAKDRSRMFAFKSGMQVFPETLAQALGVRVQTGVIVQGVRQVKKNPFPVYEIAGKRKGKPFKLQSNVVIMAVPSYILKRFLAPLDGDLTTTLDEIYYPPVAEVFLGYRTSGIARSLDGFGFLVPAKEKRSILGTIWSSSLFPDRAPAGHAALTTFVGGSRQPEVTERDNKELITMVHEELASIMGVQERPVYHRIARWQKAIPQYNLGHLSRVAQMEKFEQSYPGIFLSGNFRGGIAVGDCIINSEKTAQRVQEYFKKRQPGD